MRNINRCRGHDDQVVGKGQLAAAGLWKDHQLAGFLVCDNFSTRAAISAQSIEILSLYAQQLGSLLSQHRKENELRQIGRRQLLLNELARPRSNMLRSICSSRIW